MKPSKPTVAVVDHDRESLARIASFLGGNGFEVVSAGDAEAGFNLIDARPVDCLVTELKAPRIDGAALLSRALERNPETCAVVMVGPGEVEKAVEAMRRGAYDFHIRPPHLDKLLVVLRRGLSHQALVAHVAEFERRLDERLGLDRLSGRSRAIQRVMDQVHSIADTRATVLIEGETGVGKGLLAHAIHRHSARRDAPFVRVGLGALAESVVEGELFGLEDASHTRSRPGRIEQADGGSLFLDGIGDIAPGVQIGLLRYLQERAFERVGGAVALKCDVRVIASTDRDLAADVRAGRFRSDLLERLAGVRIAMPSLRDRREDIPFLVEVFIQEFNREHRRRVTGITRGALDRLMKHDWPGNVRELKHTVEGMVAFADGRRTLETEDLPPNLRAAGRSSARLAIAVGMTVAEAERHLIETTLEHVDQDKPRAAAMLGIGLRTLYRKIEQYKRLG